MGWEFFDKYGQKRAEIYGGPSMGVILRKRTAKTVVNTITETDLLNGECTVAANALGLDKHLQLKASGDWKQNSGNGTNIPRFKVKFGGGAALLDVNILNANGVYQDANRWGWGIIVDIYNLGVANSQLIKIEGWIAYVCVGGANAGVTYAGFTTGEGSLTGVYPGNSVTVPVRAVFGGVNTAAVDTASTDRLLELTVINPVANANLETKLISAEARIL